MESHHHSRPSSGHDTEVSGPKQPEVSVFSRNESKSAQKAKRGPLRSWSWEITSLLFAIVLLIAIIALPAHYNDKVTRRWPYDISLNTIIAILSTFMRASMMLVVAELVGQMGWQAFRKPRPVSDLYHFDNASRGILGAIKLCWNVPPRLVSIVAAIVIILSPAIAPFSQQAVRTVPCPREVEGSASLPISHWVPRAGSSYRFSPISYEVSNDMKASMINGLVNPAKVDTDIQATCATGNCTFAETSKGVTHASIAMCSSCLDTTELIKLNVDKTGENMIVNYTLPNNQWFEPVGGGPLISAVTGDIDWALGGVDSEFAELAKRSLTNVTVLTSSQSACKVITSINASCPDDRFTGHVPKYRKNENPVAATCALYPCMKQYHAQVKGGKLIEKVVDEEPLSYVNYNSSKVAATINRTAILSPCLVDGQEYNMDNFSRKGVPNKNSSPIEIDGTNYTVPKQCLYQIGFQYGMALESYMEHNIFNAYCMPRYTAGSPADCGDQWWLLPLFNSSYETLNTAFQDFTTAITNNFRAQAAVAWGMTEEDKVTGTVYETTVCTVFDWRWVLLPAGLMAVTTAMLVCLVVQSYTNPALPVWKTSILPLLFYGPNIWHDETESTDLHDLQRQAGKVRAKFQDDDGIKLRRLDTRATES